MTTSIGQPGIVSRIGLVGLILALRRRFGKGTVVSEQSGSKRRRLDHNLYTAEGVVVLGAALFLVGFTVQKSSDTPGRIFEAAGFVVFALGLFAVAATGYYLSRHYARTTAEPGTRDPSNFVDVPRPQFGFLNTRVQPSVNDPVAMRESDAHEVPENDFARARRIEKERSGAADEELGLRGDQPFPR
jgi:hypothetical protein